MPGACIGDFWEWWAEHGRSSATRALASGDWAKIQSRLQERVAAVSPDLAWQIGPGDVSQNCLVISGGGVAEFRRLAQLCVDAAPPPDPAWEYAASRAATPGWEEAQLQLPDGDIVDISATMTYYEVDLEDWQRVHVRLWNPAIAAMAAGEERAAVSFMVLDAVLGEDRVARWLGGLDVALEQPEHAVSLAPLVQLIQKLDEQGVEPHWQAGMYRRPDGQLVQALVRKPLKWVDYPLLDQHVVIEVDKPNRRVSRLVQQLLDSFMQNDDRQSLILVADEESELGQRTLHFYANHDDADCMIQLKRSTDAIPGAVLKAAIDASFDQVHYLAGPTI